MSSTSEGAVDAPAPKRRAETGPALLPLGWRAYTPPRWWFEVTVLVVLDLVYEHLRNLVPYHEQEAINRGWKLLEFTQSIHLDVELPLNQFLVRHEWLAQIANYDYSFLHLPVTGGVLIWLFWKHRRVYKTARTVLVFTTILGLIGFWIVPMAPPRLLPGAGFVDTVVYFHTFGSWGTPTVAQHSNLYAAMPSLHCAWSLWAGLGLFFVARWRILRLIGLLYPIWTVFVVMGTANHFIFDAIAGWACVGLSIAVVWMLFGHAPWKPAMTKEELTLTRDPKKKSRTRA